MKLHAHEKWLTHDEVFAEVEERLISYGLAPSLKCCRQLAEVVTLWALDDKRTGLPPQLTKTIYPEIAKRWRCAPAAVERNCRHALDIIASADLTRARCLRELRLPVNSAFPTVARFVGLLAALIPSKKLLL